MNTETVHPSDEQLKSLAGSVPEGVPVLMLNLLKFREAAVYPEDLGEAPCTGREAYAKYARAIKPLLSAVGGKLVLAGSAAAVVIGPDSCDWDSALVVRYPDTAAFFRMIRSESYAAALHHRTAAVADSRLIALQPDNQHGPL